MANAIICFRQIKYDLYVIAEHVREGLVEVFQLSAQTIPYALVRLLT